MPGRAPVRKLLETLQEWLANLPLDRIPYNAVLDLVNNKMRVSPFHLPLSMSSVALLLSLPARGPAPRSQHTPLA